MTMRIACPRCGALSTGETAVPGRCRDCGAGLVLPADAGDGAESAGQRIDGRYRVVRVVGRGGNGVVYQAVDERTGRDVAVKMFLDFALYSPETVARFKREAEVLLKIVHPNVLPVFDTGKHRGCLYIAMSYVPGQSLKELIPAGGFPDPRRAVRLAITLAETLHYVYNRHRVLHRDVKPANLMLADGDDSALYLMDFGLAYRGDPGQARLTANQAVLGTPGYMSPEQVKGNLAEVGHPTDIYSAGVTLYQMLIGKLPFGGSGFKLFVQITDSPPDPPSKHRPDIDPALDRIVLKAMAKKPADRYPAGRDFAADLGEWLVTRSGVRVTPADRAAAKRAVTDWQPTPMRPPPAAGPGPTVLVPVAALKSWQEPAGRAGPNRVAAAAVLVVGLLAAAAVAYLVAGGGLE